MLCDANKVYSSIQLRAEGIRTLRHLFTRKTFPIMNFDKEIQKFLQNRLNRQPTSPDEQSSVKLYYKNQVTSQYKVELGNLRDTMDRHIKKFWIKTKPKHILQ